MEKNREKSERFKTRFGLSQKMNIIGIVLIVLGGTMIYHHRSKTPNMFESGGLPNGKNTNRNNFDERIKSEDTDSVGIKKNTSRGSLVSLNSNGSSSVSGREIDAFADGFNQWLSAISRRDDLMKPFKAIKLFESLNEEYDHLGTMQGKVVLCVDGGEPIFSGNYYVQLEDAVPAVPRTDPWLYNIRICDSKNGMNILANTKLHGWEKLPAWVESNGIFQEATPSEAVAELPYMIVSPLSTIRMPMENRDEFFSGVIETIHKSSSEEGNGLSGGPFWVFDRAGCQYWLSETGELRRLTVARRFTDGSGGFDVDKTYEEYQEVNGIRYPKKISMKIKAVGSGGVEYIKKLTGKAKTEALVEVTLPNLRINTNVSSKWFENKIK